MTEDKTIEERLANLERNLKTDYLWAGVDKLNLKRGEILVIKTRADIDEQELERVADQISTHCGFTVKVLLLDRDTEMTIIGEESQG